MKNIYLAILFILISTVTFGQSFVILDTLGNDVTNQTFNVVLNDTVMDINIILDYDFHITNVSGVDKEIKVRKTELDVISGSLNYFCWVLCYPPTTITSSESFLLASGDTTHGTENLVCDYMPYGNVGTSTIIYTIYNVSDFQDQVSITVNFTYDIVSSTPSISKKEFFSKPYPNPTNNFINLNYSLSNNSNKIVICDILGNVVYSQILSNSEGIFRYNTQKLTKGIYFCSLFENNIPKETYRFVVSR